MIKGFFKGDFDFINAHLISKLAGIDETLELVIDMEVTKTVILDKNAITLGIDYEKLKDERTWLSIMRIDVQHMLYMLE